MESLPADVTRSVLYLLDDADLANVCFLNRDFSKKLCDDTFWLNKIINKYGLTSDEIKKYKKNNSYLAYYVKLSEDTENLNPNDMLSMGSKKERADLMIIALKRGANVHVNNDYPLRYASSYGHTEVVRLLLENGANVHANNDEALRVASGSYPDIVKLLEKYV